MIAGEVFPNLTFPQAAALQWLLLGKEINEVAQACNVSERTIRNWRQLPDFQAAFAAEKAFLIERTRSRLVEGADVAIDTLIQLCRDANQKGSVRITAAARLLSLTFRHVPKAPGPVPTGSAVTAAYAVATPASEAELTPAAPEPVPPAAPAAPLAPSFELPALDPDPLLSSDPPSTLPTPPRNGKLPTDQPTVDSLRGGPTVSRLAATLHASNGSKNTEKRKIPAKPGRNRSR